MAQSIDIQTWNEDIYEKYMRYELDFYHRYNFATFNFMEPYYQQGTTPLIPNNIEPLVLARLFVGMNGELSMSSRITGKRIVNDTSKFCEECNNPGHLKRFCPWRPEVFEFCAAMTELGVKFILDLSSLPPEKFPPLNPRPANLDIPLRRNLPPAREVFMETRRPMVSGKSSDKSVKRKPVMTISRPNTKGSNNAANQKSASSVNDDMIEKLRAENLALKQTLEAQQILLDEKRKEDDEKVLKLEKPDVLTAENLWLTNAIESQAVLGEDLLRQVAKYQELLKMLNIPDEFENSDSEFVESHVNLSISPSVKRKKFE